MEWKWTGPRALELEGTTYTLKPEVTLKKALDHAEEIEVAAQVHTGLDAACRSFQEGRAATYENAKANFKHLVIEFRKAGEELNKLGADFCGYFEPAGLVQKFKDKVTEFATLVMQTCQRLDLEEAAKLTASLAEPGATEEPATPLPPPDKDGPKPPTPPGEEAA